MKHYIHNISLLLAVICGIALTACQDDTFRGLYPDQEGGELNVSFSVTMPSMAKTELSSRGSAGDLIKAINTLHVFVYKKLDDENYTLAYHCDKADLKNWKDVTNDKHPGYPYPSENDYATEDGEAVTPGATFGLDYQFETGKAYEIYAIANVTEPAEGYATAFPTPGKLKAYTVDWDLDNIANNAQMLGMFAIDNDNDGEIVDGAPVTFLNGGKYNLHAWLIRCASKVTVDFNTEELNDNTWIYLYDVTIHNVPMQCHLRDGNTATVEYPTHDDGERIIYAPGGDYENAAAQFSAWPVLSRGSEHYGSDHSETAEALYFYENLQGKGKDKAQVCTTTDGYKPDEVTHPDGVNAPEAPGHNENTWRDGKPYGTYIEVRAYYRSSLKGNEGQGTIKYRFMLGMDTETDYNAFRNHHYKLTLNFRGNANDVDWHIDYDRNNDNPIYAPQPFYISYLYGENVEMPLAIDGKLTKGTKVIAEIVENNWKPKDAPSTIYWNGPVQSAEGMMIDGPWHGFLSLRPTNSISNIMRHGDDFVTNADAIGRESDNVTEIKEKDIAENKMAYLMSYWYGGKENMGDIANLANIDQTKLYSSAVIDANEKMHVPMQGYRVYDTEIRNGRTYDKTENNEDTYEIMEVERNGKTTTHVSIPLYTRALFMVKGLGYSGANPYFHYQRKAVVKITCWVDDEHGKPKKYTKLCDVIQVRRIINPSGIYRRAGNNKSFNVNLCFRTEEKSNSFMPFASEGKWSAEIESGDPGFINLNGQQRVQGSTGEYVNFQVNFIPTSAKKNRYAVILVKYHDYTCKHRIMVRQGYAPDVINDGGVKWHCFNLRGGEKEAESPIEAGSQFRFGNKYFGIDAQANTTAQFGMAPGDKTFEVSGLDGTIAGKVKWWTTGAEGLNADGNGPSEDTPNLAFEAISFDNFKDATFAQPFTIKDKDGNEVTARLPKYKDWKELRENARNLYTFGICYDDNSSGTSMAAEQAFNYLHSSEEKTGSGMRGIFVFNTYYGRNIFLPVGASGYGRRKSGKINSFANFDAPGTLRYANRTGYTSNDLASRMPSFWNIKDNLGAIYWGFPEKFEEIKGKPDVWNKEPVYYFTTWDINVSTYDFNQFSSNAYSNNENANINNAGLQNGTNFYFSDSGFLRLVEE